MILSPIGTPAQGKGNNLMIDSAPPLISYGASVRIVVSN